MPRPKLFHVRLTLPITAPALVRIDAALAPGETRLDLIRAAIEREVKSRARASAERHRSVTQGEAASS